MNIGSIGYGGIAYGSAGYAGVVVGSDATAASGFLNYWIVRARRLSIR